MKDWSGNKSSIYTTIGASNHVKEERAHLDYYATDPIAIDKLLSKINLCHDIWECACGEGHLAERLIKNGYNVFRSDIAQRNYSLDFIQDFLTDEELNEMLPLDFDIVTNPPYKFAKEFVLKALKLISSGRQVCMFLKLTFLEGKNRFKELFSKHPPKKVLVFSERVACAKNGDFEGLLQGGGSAVAYAWFIWQKDCIQNETIIEWI